MVVLIACEFSGVVRRAFRALGHDAWSCDLLDAEDASPYHYRGDVLDILDDSGWDLVIAHPPCTYLTRAGWHWVNQPDCATLPLKGKPRRQAADEAATFFRAFLNARALRICVENPRPICHVGLPPPQQTIQPWQFGHEEMKATCLWLKGLPLLQPTHIVGPPPKDKTKRRSWAKVHNASPGPDRWKVRSRTYEGIAAAMAAQWGSL